MMTEIHIRNKTCLHISVRKEIYILKWVVTGCNYTKTTLQCVITLYDGVLFIVQGEGEGL